MTEHDAEQQAYWQRMPEYRPLDPTDMPPSRYGRSRPYVEAEGPSRFYVFKNEVMRSYSRHPAIFVTIVHRRLRNFAVTCSDGPWLDCNLPDAWDLMEEKLAERANKMEQ